MTRANLLDQLAPDGGVQAPPRSEKFRTAEANRVIDCRKVEAQLAASC